MEIEDIKVGQKVVSDGGLQGEVTAVDRQTKMVTVDLDENPLGEGTNIQGLPVPLQAHLDAWSPVEDKPKPKKRSK